MYGLVQSTLAYKRFIMAQDNNFSKLNVSKSMNICPLQYFMLFNEQWLFQHFHENPNSCRHFKAAVDSHGSWHPVHLFHSQGVPP